MLALREEVEQEYADRMEELREMYRSEMDSQNDKYEAEKAKMRMLEASLQVSFKIHLRGGLYQVHLRIILTRKDCSFICPMYLDMTQILPCLIKLTKKDDKLCILLSMSDI